MKKIRLIAFYCALLIVTAGVHAQKSAPSSHMVFDDHFDGDIIINQVRVPKMGEAMFTYYETLGWRGLGSGYAGIQSHPKARNFIFSIWDNKSHTAPIKAVFHGPGTETKKFGGEGTGLKSWNFKLGWSTDVWYTFVARAWPVGKHTHFAVWVQAGDTKKWTHLVTMDVAVPNARFRGGTDAFIEDWVNTGKNVRVANLRGGWKRKMDGTWFPFGQTRYSVNSWDLVKGKRSYDFRTNWDGGVSKDKTGAFYYMKSGGAMTKPTSKNPSKHVIKRAPKTPSYTKSKFESVTASVRDSALEVRWKTADTTLPQFGYRCEVYGDQACKGAVLAKKIAAVAHARSATLDVSALDLDAKPYYLQVSCVDILGGVSVPHVVRIGKQSKK